jgi:hypothetical protein
MPMVRMRKPIGPVLVTKTARLGAGLRLGGIRALEVDRQQLAFRPLAMDARDQIGTPDRTPRQAVKKETVRTGSILISIVP